MNKIFKSSICTKLKKTELQQNMLTQTDKFGNRDTNSKLTRQQCSYSALYLTRFVLSTVKHANDSTS